MANSAVTTSAAVLLMLLSGCSGPTAQSHGASSSYAPQRSPGASSDAASLQRYYEQDVAWRPCEAGFECGLVTVPLDYAAPAGPSIDLAIVRHKARAPKGSLLLNPGGPGASGIAQARAADRVLSPAILTAYDVIGFDPRGVAGSTPVDCLTDAELDDFLAADWTPDNPEEEAVFAAASSSLGEGCLSDPSAIASHMGTADVARDMDILRAVLGDERLNYLGWSYGSYLGQAYAALFPNRVGRMVLDGILPLSTGLEDWFGEQAAALDAALRRFVADCPSHPTCPLTGTVDDGIGQIQDFLSGLDQHPLPGWGERALTESMALNAMLYSLYLAPGSWDDLRNVLGLALEGNGGPMLDVADSWLDRNPAGGFWTNYNEANWGVTCLDVPASGGVDHARSRADEWSLDAPTFGRYNAWTTLPCSQWPAARGATPLSASVSYAGQAQALLVSTTHDPATPYEWGVQVAEVMAGATLLTYDGDGHTAYRRGSSCIDAAVDAYLIGGTLPPAGTTCTPD